MNYNFLNFYKPKTLTQYLIFFAAIGITLTSPAGTRNFLKELNKFLAQKRDRYKNIRPGQISQALYYLKKRKLICVREFKNKTIIELTEKGRKRKLEYELENLFVAKPKQWDKRWRMLMFDIPESRKYAREALRNKLKEMNFLQFQKSVWIYPYPCESEIDFISEFFSIAKYLTILTVEIKEDGPLRAYFNL